jgi:8-oxo-dGTP pyrophosphatase MutT (NUDIX family)
VFPGGHLESGEAPRDSARRELHEETGFQSEAWAYLGGSPSTPIKAGRYPTCSTRPAAAEPRTLGLTTLRRLRSCC